MTRRDLLKRLEFIRASTRYGSVEYQHVNKLLDDVEEDGVNEPTDTVDKLRKMVSRLCEEFYEVNWQGAMELREEASELLRETR